MLSGKKVAQAKRQVRDNVDWLFMYFKQVPVTGGSHNSQRWLEYAPA
jgi:hypothetical protein